MHARGAARLPPEPPRSCVAEQPEPQMVHTREPLGVRNRSFASDNARLTWATARRRTRTSLCQVTEVGLLVRRGLWPVLAGVKVGPARARGACPGGAPPVLRLRSGLFGAY